MKKIIYQIQQLADGGMRFIKTVSRKSKVYRAIERLREADPKGVFIVSPVLPNKSGAAFESPKALAMTAGAR